MAQQTLIGRPLLTGMLWSLLFSLCLAGTFASAQAPAKERQEKAVLKVGTYAYGPAKLPHKDYCASDVSCVLFIAFESPLDAVPVASTTK